METGDLFVITSIISTVEIYSFFILMLTNGAKINDLDNRLKENLIRISKDFGRMEAYDANERIYSAAGKTVILNEISSKNLNKFTDEKWYKSETSDQVFSSLKGFEKVNLEKKLDFISGQLSQTIDYLDH
jgi:superfamily II helicase